MQTDFNWDSVQQEDMREFINFDDTNKLILMMEENAPFQIIEGEKTKYNREMFLFHVTIPETGERKTFGTSSKRFMFELKNHMPIAGKTFEISRDGYGYDMQYTVKDITGNK
jgi:hypothetical protein